MCWRPHRQSVSGSRRGLARGQRAIALAGLASAALLLPATGAPAASSWVPPKPNVLLGVSDRGTAAEFDEFTRLSGKHPALLETFHPWGNSLNEAYERWRETATRPILHISPPTTRRWPRSSPRSRS